MKKILVFGGTRFFGEKTVKEFLKMGYEVTIATRGTSGNPFGESVTQVIVDRADGTHEGWNVLASVSWDAVFDNICFTKEDAQLAIDKLSGKTSYYLFTSTLAVYEGEKDGYTEEDFDPFNYQIDPSKEVTYGEGKRQAEATFAQKSNFSLGILRIPIVLGTDDYTERLHFYIRKALFKEDINLENDSSHISFIQANDVARVILWMIDNHKTGAYNASSTDALSLKDFLSLLSEKTDATLHVHYGIESGQRSPFSLPHHYYLRTGKITDEGLVLPELHTWLHPLIDTLYAELKKD